MDGAPDTMASQRGPSNAPGRAGERYDSPLRAHFPSPSAMHAPTALASAAALAVCLHAFLLLPTE